MENKKMASLQSAESSPEDLELEGYQRLGFARGSSKILELLEAELGSLATFRILDVGCGYGGISLALARKARKVRSVDLKEAELAHLQRWRNDRGVTNLYVVG